MKSAALKSELLLCLALLKILDVLCIVSEDWGVRFLTFFFFFCHKIRYKMHFPNSSEIQEIMSGMHMAHPSPTARGRYDVMSEQFPVFGPSPPIPSPLNTDTVAGNDSDLTLSRQGRRVPPRATLRIITRPKARGGAGWS